MRIELSGFPYFESQKTEGVFKRGIWPAFWISAPGAGASPLVTAYRCCFKLENPEKVRMHVTGDERYHLFLDGKRLGRGPERGDRWNWFVEPYEVEISAGEHVLAAMVFSLGSAYAPHAQIGVKHGFFCCVDGPLAGVLSTGEGNWEAKLVDGYYFEGARYTWAVGANYVMDGKKLPWGIEQGKGEGWQPAVKMHLGIETSIRYHEENIHRLRTAMLPAMKEIPWRGGKVRAIGKPENQGEAIPYASADAKPGEIEGWQSFFNGKPISIPANTAVRVLLDLDDYLCAYPTLVTSDGEGATVTLGWAEALFNESDAKTKGNRDAIEGKFFRGESDRCILDGGQMRAYSIPWWRAGRYVEVTVRTADKPATLERLELAETGYPLAQESKFSSDDKRLENCFPILTRALQMCMHETYMDCPYYEQLMYVGDTRLEVLATYTLTHDDHMPRKAIEMFGESRFPRGLTRSCYPDWQNQIIPPFSLWWVCMVYDYAIWRNDRDFVRKHMLGVRGVLDHFWSCIAKEGKEAGLLRSPEGWSFTDWTRSEKWVFGVPPDACGDFSGIINWHLVYTLDRAAELEEIAGEPELAQLHRRRAETLAKAVDAAFWNEDSGLYSDELSHEEFSEHAQCLALLSRRMPENKVARIKEGLFSNQRLIRATIYFMHYLFEACTQLKCTDKIFDRLGLWFGLRENGFRTTPEAPEPSRSDCHAWGAHPYYHAFASLAGIRPAAPGFAKVLISPQPAHLKQIKLEMPHPKGVIALDLAFSGDKAKGKVSLPAGISGTFVFGSQKLELAGGSNNIG